MYAAPIFLLGLAACETVPGRADTTVAAADDGLTGSEISIEERDIQRPDVFTLEDIGLWDGRPSFGGVWVAIPTNVQPERVTITNVATGDSVVGALYKRERDNPGPAIQLSSDAADALNVVPGEPTPLTITALRRETIASEEDEDGAQVFLENDPFATEGVEPPPVTAAAEVEETTEGGGFFSRLRAALGGDGASSVADPIPVATDATTTITETTVPALAGATAALVADEEAPVETASLAEETVTAPPARPEARAPAPAPAVTGGSDLSRPFIQVGTFSSRENADVLVGRMRVNGLTGQIREQTTDEGKALYRVLAGPAVDEPARDALANQVTALGFADAFPVAQ